MANKKSVKKSKKSMARCVVLLKSTGSPHFYSTYKNKRNSPTKLEIRKYDPVIRKHVLYKEGK